MISDRKIPKTYTVNSTFADYYDPVVLSAMDYFPFGMEMPGRTMASGGYRYGFNGKEKDTEGEWGTQTHYDYGFRIYEPRIGRFLSVDPRVEKYPSWSPYNYAKGSPIVNLDMNGDTIFIFSRVHEDGTPFYTTGQLNRILKAAKIVDMYNGVNSVYKITTMSAVHNGDLKLNRKTDLVYAIDNGTTYTRPGGITSSSPSGFGEGYLNGDINMGFMLWKSSRKENSVEAYNNAGIALSHEAVTHGNGLLVSAILGLDNILGKHTNKDHDNDEHYLSDGGAWVQPFLQGYMGVKKLKSKFPNFNYFSQKIKMANLLFEYQRLSTTSINKRGKSGHGTAPGTLAVEKKLKKHYEAEESRQ